MSGRAGLEKRRSTLLAWAGLKTGPYVLLAWLAIATPLAAQERDDHDVDQRASFTSGASLGDGDPALALSAGLALRLASRLELEFELAYARTIDFTLDLCPAPRVCAIGGQAPVIGRTVSLVPHLVVDLLPPGGRVHIYAQAGAGLGHVRQRYFLAPLPRATDVDERTRSHVVLAVSAGGGLMVDLTRRLAIGVDVRSLHLLDEDPTPDLFITPAGWLDTVRLGARASWRF